MSVLHFLAPREHWYVPRRHAVCVPCHRHGRVYCEVRYVLLRLGIVEAWWWLTDAPVMDTNEQTHARTWRTKRIVPTPPEWEETERLFDRLYEEANRSRDDR